ncbi:MAG TPA: hypothetical protein PLR06_11525 [Cyclobacteriaceae bacterium]|nr:hypothetical protein [Cyclobacteriaceae bacterium]
MKKITFLFCVSLLAAACNPKKAETAGVTDSVSVDNAVQATEPAPATLAFNPLSGYLLNNKLTFKDSVNYFLLSSQEELNEKFNTDPAVRISSPDFVINHIVAVALKPSPQLATITLDKVEVVDTDINVYINVQYGAKQESVAKPAQIFAIEKRDGMIAIQFWVNGKKGQAIMLV